jgi:hypothetical protein
MAAIIVSATVGAQNHRRLMIGAQTGTAQQLVMNQDAPAIRFFRPLLPVWLAGRNDDRSLLMH